LPAPKLALRFLLGEMADFLFDSIRVVPAALGSGGFNFKYGNLRDALAAIVGN
jgi:NAD dependent epimerase/dehydratase family enzyme